jgi:hypothetical protein
MLLDVVLPPSPPLRGIFFRAHMHGNNAVEFRERATIPVSFY